MRKFLFLFVLLFLFTTHDARSQEREGFTLLLTLGYGLQSDDVFKDQNDWQGGLSGLSLGIGGFATPDLALMARFAGTNVTYDYTYPGASTSIDRDAIAGVLAFDGQYWVNDRFNVEAGAGFGFADTEGRDSERGLGLFLGAGYAFLVRTKHSLQVGVEYTPVFLDSDRTIQSIGFNLGFQFL